MNEIDYAMFFAPFILYVMIIYSFSYLKQLSEEQSGEIENRLALFKCMWSISLSTALCIPWTVTDGYVDIYIECPVKPKLIAFVKNNKFQKTQSLLIFIKDKFCNVPLQVCQFRDFNLTEMKMLLSIVLNPFETVQI